jgi:hypothetical protein
MILIVVVGMSIAFAYFTDYVKNFQIGQGSSIMELIEVEDVWFKDQSTISVTLYNYGPVSINIANLYINDRIVDFTNYNGLSNNAEIPIGEHGVVFVDYALNENTFYHFRIVSDRGSIFEGRYLSPAIW